MTQRILILCTGNSCRSIMAEALLNQLGAPLYQAFSAGSHPKGFIHPLTLETLEKYHINPGTPHSKSWDVFEGQAFDFVITVCDVAAQESCPIFLGKSQKQHWSTPDPSKISGTKEEIDAAFEASFQTLKAHIAEFIFSNPFLLDKEETF